MGRVKIPMKKIEVKKLRNIAFAKRKNGLLKKAYELYIFCDVQIALAFLSPAGKLFLFETKRRIEETIRKYVDMPCYKRGSLKDEVFIRRWIKEMQLGSSEKFDDEFYQTRVKDVEDEIKECNEVLVGVKQQLGYFLKNPNQWESMDEIDYQENLLQTTLTQVRSRKEHLEVESKLFDVSSWPLETNLEI